MIQLVVFLLAVGLALYLLQNDTPVDPAMKAIIRFVVIVCVLAYLAQLFGFVDVPIPRLHR